MGIYSQLLQLSIVVGKFLDCEVQCLIDQLSIIQQWFWPIFSLIKFVFKLSLQHVCKHEQLQVFYFWRHKSGASYVAQGLKLITTLHGEVMGTFSLNSFHIKYIVWVGVLQFRKLREKKKCL